MGPTVWTFRAAETRARVTAATGDEYSYSIVRKVFGLYSSTENRMHR